MSIMKAVNKCEGCYRDDNCLYTATQKETCPGPYENRAEHLLALKEYIILNGRRIKSEIRRPAKKKKRSFNWTIRRNGHA